MNHAKERACGEDLSNRLVERFERKTSFARSISDNDYESARIGIAAKRCAERGKRYSQHAVRTPTSALMRMNTSNRASMSWSMSGLNSLRSLIYLDWIEDEITEEIESEGAKTISGWAPKEKRAFVGAKVSRNPWLPSKVSRPTRIFRTPKGTYQVGKSEVELLQKTANHPSLPDLPERKKQKATPLQRLRAKESMSRAQRHPAYKAVRSLGPSLNQSSTASRLMASQHTNKKAAKTPFERLFNQDLQQDKTDRQVAASDVAVSRMQRGSSHQKRARGLRPTWNRSPMMNELLKVHDGGHQSREDVNTVDTQTPEQTNRNDVIRTKDPMRSSRRPSSRIATRSALDIIDNQDRSIMPTPTVDRIKNIMSSERSRDAFGAFNSSALRIAQERRLIESLRRSSGEALPPVSIRSQRTKRLRSREAGLLNPANKLAQFLPQSMQSRLKLPWPSSSLGEEHVKNDADSDLGMEAIHRRGEVSELESFAERLQSEIQPYESNVSAFEPAAADSKRGATKELWLVTPNMVVTEPHENNLDDESEELESAPRISAWTGAPVVDTPWLSRKPDPSPVRVATNRLSQHDNSRKERSVMPRLKSVQPEVDQLVRRLTGPVKAQWRQFVEQVGTLSAGQQQKLQSDVNSQRTAIKVVPQSVEKGQEAAPTSSHRSMSQMQHASIREVVSRSGNPTRGVMTSILAASKSTGNRQLSQAMDAIQKKKTLQNSDLASKESFWVDVLRSQQHRSKNRISRLSYGRPESVVVVPGLDLDTRDHDESETSFSAFYDSVTDSSSLSALPESVNRTPAILERSGFETTLNSPKQSLARDADEKTSIIEHAYERSEIQPEFSARQKRFLNQNQERLPAWAKGWNIPEAQYLDALQEFMDNDESDAVVSKDGRSKTVNGWGGASVNKGAKQLAYIHKSGQIIPVSHAKQAGLPAPKPGSRSQLPLGWTLEAVDAQMLNRAMPGWAQRASEKPLIRGTSDMVKALVNARSQDEVIRVIFDRANETMPELQSLPTSATRVIEQIRKEAYTEQVVAEERKNSAQSRLLRTDPKTRNTSNVVSDFSGLKAISTAKKTVQESEDRVSSLAKKLQDLVLLAEEKSRKEAREGIRMADNDESSHQEAAAMSHEDAPTPQTSHDIDAFFQAVIDAYERERDFRKDRDGYEGNANKNRTTWW